ncbi:unnamed protein product [Agarophyton chilense]
MSNPNIIPESVSQLVDGLLLSVFENVRDQKVVPVVDLENEPQPVKSDDDDITIVNQRKQQKRHDEVEIVSAQLTQPIQKPNHFLDADAIDVDLLEDLEIQHSRPRSKNAQQIAIDVDTLDTNVTTAPPALQPAVVPVGPPPVQRVSVPDVVECTFTGSGTSTRPQGLMCDKCDTVLLKSRPLTRCKHLLCALCRLRAVTNVSGKENPIASIVHKLPVCVVPRCGAPFSNVEALEALAPDVADSAFRDAHQSFCIWTQAAVENDVTGARNVEFPPYSDSERTRSVKGGQALTCESLANPDSLLEDDFAAAVNPLWVWDSEHKSCTVGVGAWLCVACGAYEEPMRDIAVSIKPPPIETSDNEPPSVPIHPHCAYARALAVTKYIESLSEAQEEERSSASKPKSLKHSAPKKTSRTRKRYRSVSSVQARKRQKKGFAKGTGYAGGTGTEWNGASSNMLQKKNRVDNEVAFWLRRLRCVLLLGNEGLHTWPGFMRILLRECKLIPKLASILINESIMDVEERIPVFVSALRVVHTITESPQLRTLIVHSIGELTGRSIAELVESLSQQAAFLSTGARHGTLPGHTAVLIKQIRRCIRMINRHRLLEKPKSNADVSTVNLDGILAESDENGGELGKENMAGGDETKLHVGEDLLEEDKTAYIQEMRQHQFKVVPGLITSSIFQSTAKQKDQTSVPHPGRQKRIATEVASLLSSLPLSWSSSILLRVDEDRYDILRACIFGPEDTPYDSGAFLFDIYLPMDYPVNPPKFTLLTTGAGKVRFNPNLYQNGKVCLSLLGTWSGPSWNQSSTILQVLVSIQSLIFVADPYFNEPGYERYMGTSQGKLYSEQYNSRIRFHSAFHAIQTQIRYPPQEFAEGITAHFRLKRKYVKSILARWFPDAAMRAKEEKGESSTNTNGHGITHVTPDPMLQSLHMVLANAASSTAAHASNQPQQVLSQVAAYEPGRNYRSPTAMTSANLKGVFDALDGCALKTPVK